jgi:hypothetical protein
VSEHSNQNRTAEFARNPNLESYLGKLNDLLWLSEKKVLKEYTALDYPLILIIGAPRSGTTLLFQWLAATGKFTYPTNFISRFYHAPYIGALIQQLLTDPDLVFRDEMKDTGFDTMAGYHSRLGKTDGFLSPNEFWYFWRRFFDYKEIQHLENEELSAIDTKDLISELAAFESVLSLPLLMKGMMFNWNLPFIKSLFPNILFLYIRRGLTANSYSLLNSRIHFFGKETEWYSFKPPEYPMLKQMDPVSQVAGQVYFTNKSIEDGLGVIPEKNKLSMEYEGFCKNPRDCWDTLRQKLYALGYDEIGDYQGPDIFEVSIHNEISNAVKQKISAAHTLFTGLYSSSIE